MREVDWKQGATKMMEPTSPKSASRQRRKTMRCCKLGWPWSVSRARLTWQKHPTIHRPLLISLQHKAPSAFENVTKPQVHQDLRWSRIRRRSSSITENWHFITSSLHHFITSATLKHQAPYINIWEKPIRGTRNL